MARALTHMPSVVRLRLIALASLARCPVSKERKNQGVGMDVRQHLKNLILIKKKDKLIVISNSVHERQLTKLV